MERSTPQSKTIARTFEGAVVSKAGDKTLTVLVETRKLNVKYQKQYSTRKKYAVHDEKNQAVPGDVVVFQECRPLSKRKRWNLVRIK